MRLKNISVVLLILFSVSCNINDEYKFEGDHVYFRISDFNECCNEREYKMEADPKTFKILNDGLYAKDKNHAFYKGGIINDADAASFEALNSVFSKDKNRGYRNGNPIKTSRGNTFKNIDKYFYSTDGIDVFYDTFPMHVCSTKNFKFPFDDDDSQWEWTTDGCFYYIGSFKIPSNDYSNVILYKNFGIAKDKHWVYCGNHKMNYENYSNRKIFDTIDAATFENFGGNKFRDKFGCIEPNRGRISCDNK